MQDLVSLFLQYTEPEESPESYFRWCLYTAVGAILRDNCYCVTRIGRIYPNLYTILLSTKSSTTRKDNPINLAIKLAREINNTHIIQGRATIGGIIKVLNSTYTSESGELIQNASAFIVSGELTASLMSDDYTLDTLTDLYGYHDLWASTLSMDGVRVLKKVCITLLSATNIENIGTIYNKRAERGGLLARTMLIRESKRRKIHSFRRGIGDTSRTNNWNEILKCLKIIGRMRGEFKFTEHADEEFNKWYESITDDKFSESGIEARLPTDVLKIAMILTACRRSDMTIEKETIIEAIDTCVKLLPNYGVLTMTGGDSNFAKPSTLIVRELFNAGESLTKAQILQRLIRNLDSETFLKSVDTLVDAKLIICSSNGRDMKFELTEHCKQMLESKLKGREL